MIKLTVKFTEPKDFIEFEAIITLNYYQRTIINGTIGVYYYKDTKQFLADTRYLLTLFVIHKGIAKLEIEND